MIKLKILTKKNILNNTIKQRLKKVKYNKMLNI